MRYWRNGSVRSWRNRCVSSWRNRYVRYLRNRYVRYIGEIGMYDLAGMGVCVRDAREASILVFECASIPIAP